MGKNTKISWCDHTFNCWWGCTKIAAGCKNCYAETLAKRFGWGWGDRSFRRTFKDAHWNEPVKWNREAEKAGVRARVFCGSMCDVFEDRPELEDHRVRLWKLIEATPWLDWLLLTKRPQNARRMLPTIQIGGEELPRFDNVWTGASLCLREDAETVIRESLQIPAAKHFLSMEPLLGHINLTQVNDGSWYDREGAQLYDALRGNAYYCDGEHGFGGGPKLDWVIVGGESGHHARPCNVEWIRSIVQQCKDAGVPVFVKQLGENVIADHGDCSTGKSARYDLDWAKGGGLKVKMRDRAGADPAEWPEDLRVRQLPEVRR